MRTHIMNKASGYLWPMLLLLLLALASWRQMTTVTGPAEPTAGPRATLATPQDELRISEEQAIITVDGTSGEIVDLYFTQ